MWAHQFRAVQLLRGLGPRQSDSRHKGSRAACQEHACLRAHRDTETIVFHPRRMLQQNFCQLGVGAYAFNWRFSGQEDFAWEIVVECPADSRHF